jgi:hypothetical protein
MSAWKDDDEVTTTYGSIQLSLEQSYAAGVKTEQQRIIKLLEKTMNLYLVNKLLLEASLVANSIGLIKGETDE